MEMIARQLEKIINEHGIEHLQRKPYEVYSKLIAAGINAAHARLVLITLLSGTSAKVMELDAANLSRDIQKECYLQKDAADEIASMYHLLFDTKNIAGWEKRKDCGFQKFCTKPWEFKWSGSGIWSSGNGHIDCWCDITAKIEVSDEEKANRVVSKILKENPFTPAETINDFFSRQISDILDEDLEDYITSDDYYPPVMEDYNDNGECALNECCEKLGLKVVVFDCDGSMSDFESDHMGW